MADESVLKNKHFCILPWVHLMVHQTGELMTCCRDGELAYKYGSLRENSLENIWNGVRAREMRLSILNGEPLEQCKNCYREEALGKISLRQSSLLSFGDPNEIVAATSQDGAVPLNKIQYLGLRLSNECNLKCRSCSPGNSVSWYKDAEAISGRKFSGVARAFSSAQELSEFLEKMLTGIKEIYFAGGEPVLQKEHYQVIESLIVSGRTDVHLVYNINFTRLKFMHWDLIQLWKKFDKVTVGASFDGVGPHAELLRSGSNWKHIEANIKRVMSEVPHLELNVFPTVSALNVFHLPEAIMQWVELGLIQKSGNLKFNLLRFPKYFDLRILNVEERNSLKAKLYSFLTEALRKLRPEQFQIIQSEIELVIQECESKEFFEKERRQFRWVTHKLDQQRNEKYLHLFPEYLEMLANSVPLHLAEQKP